MKFALLIVSFILIGCLPAAPKKTDLVFEEKKLPGKDPIVEVKDGTNFEKAVAVMNKNCLSCHNSNADRVFLLSSDPQENDFIKQSMIVPGNSRSSLLIQRMQHSGEGGGNMPLYNQDFTLDEFNTIAK